MSIETIVKTVHGSHLYGTNTPDSDTDYKGIFVDTSFNNLVLGASPKHISRSTGSDFTKNGKDDVDLELFSLKRFIDEACSGEVIALDMIHTPSEFIVEKNDEFGWIWDFIYDNRSKFYSKNIKGYLGYARKQTAKYGFKGSRMAALEEVKSCLPSMSVVGTTKTKLKDSGFLFPKSDYCKIITCKTKRGEEQTFYEVLGSKYLLDMPYIEFCSAILSKWEKYGDRARQAKENKGVDWKAVSHAFRACQQVREIFDTGDLKYPLQDAKLILDVKSGKLDWESEVAPELDKAINEMEEAAKTVDLPDKCDIKFWDDFVVYVYQDLFGLPSNFM